MDYDKDQALIKQYNYPAYIKKSIQELQGISVVIIYDNKVDDNEIRLLIEWVSKHEEIIDQFPISEIAPILQGIIKRGRSTNKDREQLFKILSSFAADPQKAVIDNIYDSDCKIQFKSKKFLFTGVLIFGERKKALNSVVELEGIPSDGSVTRDLDYLVVGDLGNETWKYSRFGSKIEKALEYRERYKKPFIITEKQFVEAVINAESYKPHCAPIKCKLGVLTGKLFVLTGALENYTREEIAKLIETLGGKVSSSVTKKTNFVIAGVESGSKLEMAIKKGVPVISEAEFEAMIQ